MPFDFLKRKKPEDAAAAPDGGQITRSGGVKPSAPPNAGKIHAGPSRGVPFIGLTEDWRLRGRMDISGRLSDALNKREAIPITDVSWGPPDNSTPLEEAPGLLAYKGEREMAAKALERLSR